MAGLDWSAVKADYMGGMGYKSLANKYRISAYAIRSKVAADGWAADRDALMADDMRRASAAAAAKDAAEAAAAEAAMDDTAKAEMLRRVRAKLLAGLDRAAAEMAEGKTAPLPADLRAVAAAYMDFVKADALITDDGGKRGQDAAIVILPERVAVADDGGVDDDGGGADG